jgi:hypothetical protein
MTSSRSPPKRFVCSSIHFFHHSYQLSTLYLLPGWFDLLLSCHFLDCTITCYSLPPPADHARRIIQKKPLTEEERLQKLAELKERMSEKRAKKAAAEAEEAKANEAIRRKAGQVGVTSIFISV